MSEEDEFVPLQADEEITEDRTMNPRARARKEAAEGIPGTFFGTKGTFRPPGWLTKQVDDSSRRMAVQEHINLEVMTALAIRAGGLIRLSDFEIASAKGKKLSVRRNKHDDVLIIEIEEGESNGQEAG